MNRKGSGFAKMAGKMNHRPHEATTGSGYYILEVIRSAGTDPQAIQPAVDFSGLCHKCHDDSEY